MNRIPRRWVMAALVAAVALLGAASLPVHAATPDGDQQMAEIKLDTYTRIFADPLSPAGALLRTGDIYVVLTPRTGTDGKTWYSLATDRGESLGWVREDAIILFTVPAP